MASLPEWMLREIPWHWQWVGLFATVAGVALSIASVAGAWVSARRAKQARDAANRAWEAAKRLGRLAQLEELSGDMQELQSFILGKAGARFITAKCDRLRGRVSRFKAENEQKLSVDELEGLDLARSHLDIMSQVCSENSKRPDHTRLQTAFGHASVAVGRVTGSHSQQISENVNVAV